MQIVQLVLVASGIIVAAAVLTDQYRRHTASDRLLPKVLLGVIPGLIGAAIVLVPRTDLLPDQYENDAWIVVAIMVTALAALGTAYRVVRR